MFGQHILWPRALAGISSEGTSLFLGGQSLKFRLEPRPNAAAALGVRGRVVANRRSYSVRPRELLAETLSPFVAFGVSIVGGAPLAGARSQRRPALRLTLCLIT